MEEKRKTPRTLVRWRSAIVSEEDGAPVTTQGMTNDINSDGVSVICHRSIPPNRDVTVYLMVERGNDDHPELVVEARGRIVYNVHSGEQGGFRLGIRFIKFAGEGEAMLRQHMPKPPAFGAPPIKAAAPR